MKVFKLEMEEEFLSLIFKPHQDIHSQYLDSTLTCTNRQTQSTEGTHELEVKRWPLFTDIIMEEDPGKSTWELLELINKSSKLTGVSL